MSNSLYTIFIFLASILSSAIASFTTFFPPSASQCADFTLNFTGKQISFPITLLLLPVASSSPQVIEVPESAFDVAKNSGSYTSPLPFAAGTQFIAVMHDAAGVGNGGVSTLYTVDGSDKSDCLPQAEGGNNSLAFTLSPSPPTQCDFQNISWTPLDPNSQGDTLANVHITGYVVSGLAFKLNVAVEGFSLGTSASWLASVPEGQEFMFFYERTDPISGNIVRETSTVQTVQPGPNSDCIRAGVPSATPQAVPSLTSSVSTASGMPSLRPFGDASDNAKGPFNLPKSALIGIIVGGVCLLAILVALLYLFCAGRHRNKPHARFRLEDGDRPTAVNTSESYDAASGNAALMKMDPNAPIGISLPAMRSSGFDMDSFYSQGTTMAGARSPSPQLNNGGGVFGRMRSRRENDNTISIASWGNKGPMIQSTFEAEPQPMPEDASTTIKHYPAVPIEYASMPTPPPPPVLPAIAMSRGGSGRGRQRVQVEGYYPTRNASTSSTTPVASTSSGRSKNTAYSASSGPMQSQESYTTESSTVTAGSVRPPPSPSPFPSPIPPPPGREAIQNYYPTAAPAPVQPPSRANPLLQRRLSEYEAYDDDESYYDDGGSTRTGASRVRPGPDEQLGIAL